MTNPYQSPLWEDASQQPQPEAVLQGRGLVKHVRPIAILMMVQGSLEILMAVFLVVLAIFMGVVFTDLQQNPPEGQNPEIPPVAAGWLLTAVYGTMAAAVGLAGGLHIWAGMRTYQLRSRGVGIGALIAGLLSAGSCYCLPTAVGLAIYGMIVLLNASVIEAFRMRAEGQTAESILLSFEQRV